MTIANEAPTKRPWLSGEIPRDCKECPGLHQAVCAAAGMALEHAGSPVAVYCEGGNPRELAGCVPEQLGCFATVALVDEPATKTAEPTLG